MDWKKSLTQSRKDAKNNSEATARSRRFEVEDLARNNNGNLRKPLPLVAARNRHHIFPSRDQSGYFLTNPLVSVGPLSRPANIGSSDFRPCLSFHGLSDGAVRALTKADFAVSVNIKTEGE